MPLPPTRQALLSSPLGGYIANLAADLTRNLLRFAGVFFHHAVVAYTPAAALFKPNLQRPL